MYVQVLEPFGALVTIEGKTEKIPFIAKIPKDKKEIYENALKKIKAKYIITGGRQYKSPVKNLSPTTKKEVKSDDKSESKKSNRKKS